MTDSDRSPPMSPETVEQIPELLPCPFCGSAAEIVEAEEAGPQAYVVQCTAPLCAVSSKVIFALKEDVTELLIEAWNRRPSSEAGKGEALLRAAAIASYMGEVQVVNKPKKVDMQDVLTVDDLDLDL